MYGNDILPKFFISGILARAMKCSILTKHSNRSYAGSIPKLQVTFEALLIEDLFLMSTSQWPVF